jgi:hypothetical protein
MAAKTQLQKILDLAGQFVTAHKCVWSHADWEELLKQLAALGIAITDESKRNLGNILESCKCFYSEAEAPAKKTTARPRKKA